FEQIGDFGNTQPGKEAQLDHFDQTFVESGELVQGGIDGDQVLGLLVDRQGQLVQRIQIEVFSAAATPVGQSGARVVDHDLSHRPCSGGIKVAAVLVIRIGVVEKL